MSARPDPAALAAIAIGGGIGSIARYGLGEAVTMKQGSLPWTTLSINIVGSLLLGMLVVAVTEIWRPHRLVRPLLGTGVLGGFTTFSTFAVETRHLPGTTASAYVALSVIGAIGAAWCGMTLVRLVEPRVRIAAEHEVVDPIDPDLP